MRFLSALSKSRLKTQKTICFLSGTWLINIIALAYCFIHSIDRYKAISACNKGEKPPAYYDWKEAVENSRFGSISAPDFCASILYATLGLFILLLFYLTAFLFLSYCTFIIIKRGFSYSKDPIFLLTAASGIFFLSVPYLYDLFLPNFK
jgi:hypothetical protein